MKYCSACNVSVANPRERCPLCQAPLGGGGDERETFPITPSLYERYSLFFRVLIFLSVTACVTVLAVNVILSTEYLWFLFVWSGIGYMWLTIIAMVRRRSSLSKKILFQVMQLSVLLFIIDLLTGFIGWSLDYAIPSICVSALLAINVIALVSKLRLNDYVIYVVANAALGLCPLIFVLTGVADVLWPSITCVLTSGLSLVAIFVFSDKKTRQELFKRFHL
ncbi:DUF6320 domain-containing protein [Oscillospiraceae bacterium OttesenSCG-928-F05]|nr:DUF6320 domain-containing protein [Oscillospiraceae bacterium OttesenSCG-928-F05]